MTFDTFTLPEVIGPEGPFGDYYYSFIPIDYEGPCALTYSGKNEQNWVIFASRGEAITAATGACRYDIGGYSGVAIYPVGIAPSGTEQPASAINWLFGTDDIANDTTAPTGVEHIGRQFMRELARRVATHPQELTNLEWRDLERLLYEVFASIGFDAEITRSAKDGGYDLKLTADGFLYLVEIKHWSQKSKVGLGIIDQFTDVVISNKAEGILLSSSGFTKHVYKARSKTTKYPIILGDHQKIISLCRLYKRSEDGLWIPDLCLRDVLFQDSL